MCDGTDDTAPDGREELSGMRIRCVDYTLRLDDSARRRNCIGSIWVMRYRLDGCVGVDTQPRESL